MARGCLNSLYKSQAYISLKNSTIKSETTDLSGTNPTIPYTPATPFLEREGLFYIYIREIEEREES